MLAGPIPLTLINIKPRCINLLPLPAAIVLKQIKNLHMNIKAICFFAGLLMVVQIQAQQQTGRVVYAFTPEMKMQVSGMQAGMAPPPPPRTPVIKMEVLFGNNQMLRRALEDNTIND